MHTRKKKGKIQIKVPSIFKYVMVEIIRCIMRVSNQRVVYDIFSSIFATILVLLNVIAPAHVAPSVLCLRELISHLLNPSHNLVEKREDVKHNKFMAIGSMRFVETAHPWLAPRTLP
jgi:hypothetical protein